MTTINENGSSRRNNKNKKVFIIASLIVVLTIVIGTIVHFKRKNKDAVSDVANAVKDAAKDIADGLEKAGDALNSVADSISGSDEFFFNNKIVQWVENGLLFLPIVVSYVRDRKSIGVLFEKKDFSEHLKNIVEKEWRSFANLLVVFLAVIGIELVINLLIVGSFAHYKAEKKGKYLDTLKKALKKRFYFDLSKWIYTVIYFLVYVIIFYLALLLARRGLIQTISFGLCNPADGWCQTLSAYI